MKIAVSHRKPKFVKLPLPVANYSRVFLIITHKIRQKLIMKLGKPMKYDQVPLYWNNMIQVSFFYYFLIYCHNYFYYPHQCVVRKQL